MALVSIRNSRRKSSRCFNGGTPSMSSKAQVWDCPLSSASFFGTEAGFQRKGRWTAAQRFHFPSHLFGKFKGGMYFSALRFPKCFHFLRRVTPHRRKPFSARSYAHTT